VRAHQAAVLFLFSLNDAPVTAKVSQAAPRPQPQAKAQAQPRHQPFQSRRADPPLLLKGTVAAGLSFLQYERGTFRLWHARGIPASRADAIWQVVAEQGRPRGITAVLDRDEEFNDFYYEQFIYPDGSLERRPSCSLDEALAARTKVLGKRGAEMQRALLQATPATRSVQPDAPPPTKKTAADKRSLVLFAAPPEEVAALCVLGDDLEPRPQELIAALHRWQERYGAVLKQCMGNHLDLAVARPPTRLPELRELAWQFYLMCPADPSGYTSSNEDPRQLLARLQEREWNCNWFVE